MEAPKPPIGIMPRFIWLHARALDLSKTIHNALVANAHNDKIKEWCTELHNIIFELEEEGHLK